ncbi:MAG: hypothetical protein ACLTDF_02005 [Coprococcus sp.]
MNRHEDELEKEMADKYIENMDAPDLWEKLRQDLMRWMRSGCRIRNLEIRSLESRKTVKSGTEEPSRSSPVLWQRQWCVLIVAGPLRNSRKRASDKTAQDNSVKVTSDESYYAQESDAAAADDIQSDAAEMAENATASYDVQRNTDAQNSVNSADYIPMIMLDGVLYRDTYDMVDADSVDESKAAYAESYTDGVPANDGEVNFDMNPSRNSAYIVCDDGSLVVKVEGNWYRFERAE